ncbi:MAG: hypothetical protein IRY99_14420 [Isosphaeraceae bacterium]|nr:hypothetical protein [Isosphaeraceae bacterium]
MGRFRNPRYAPEFLERRLSPSDPGLTVPALVATMDTNVEVMYNNSEPPPSQGDATDPPIDPPRPAGPA